MSIKCLAIDDEPIALSILKKYCERRGGIVLETYSSPRTGMQRAGEWQPDIVFLDIELNGTSGLELSRRLPAGCCLIFTTAYAHYALDGYEVNAIDFLHKPYFYERFCRAMEKAEEWLRMHDLLLASQQARRQLVLKSDYKRVSLPIDRIVYIESLDNYAKLHLSDGSTLLSKISLSRLCQQLPPQEFIRIHRSFVVARNRIAHFTRTRVRLTPGDRLLPIGKKYATEVLKVLNS